MNESKVQEGVAKQKLTFDQLLKKYAKAVPKDRSLKKTPRSPLHQGKPTYSSGEFSKRRGDVTTLFPPQKVYSTMPWMLPASDSSCPTWEHEGIWMQWYPMPHPPSHQRGGNFRRLVFDRLARLTHDQSGYHRLGQRQQPAPVRPVTTDRSHQGQGQFRSLRQVYRVKENKKEVQSTNDSEKIKADAVMQIGNIKVAVTESGTRPMVLGKSVDTSIQRPIMADDHEASSCTTTSKYFQPRWCPSGLTRTQKRKLQRL